MGEGVGVRQAGPGDVAAAAEVWYAAHLARRGGRALPKERHEEAHGRMAAPGGLLLVAEEPGTAGAAGAPVVVGAVLGEAGREADDGGPPVPGLLHIALVVVDPDRWGEGVGRLLVREVLDRAPALGHRRAQLWAHADNARTHRLCRAAGFRRTGRARIDAWGELVVQYGLSLPARPAGPR